MLSTTSFLSGNKDTDKYILRYLDINDYCHVAVTCRYFHWLLLDDSIWYEKVYLLFGAEYISDKALPISWKEWCIFWINNRYANKLVRELNMTPLQAFQAIKTSPSQGKIFPGVEIYLTNSKVFTQALKKRDQAMIEYCLERIRSTNPGDKLLRCLFNRYTRMVSLILELHDDHLLEDILRYYHEKRPHINISNFCQLVELLGYWNKERLFCQYILPSVGDDLIHDAKLFYIIGHIKAGRIELADELFEKFSYPKDEERVKQRLLLSMKEKTKAGTRYYYDHKKYKSCSSYNDLLHRYGEHEDRVNVIVYCIIKGRFDLILTIDDHYNNGLTNFTREEWETILLATYHHPYKVLNLYLVTKCAEQYPDFYADLIKRNLIMGERDNVAMMEKISNLSSYEELISMGFRLCL